MPKKITDTSPYGVILLGDIAVEFGHPSLAVPLSQSITVTLEILSQKEVYVSVPARTLEHYPVNLKQKTDAQAPELAGILHILYDRFPALPGLHIEVTGEYGKPGMFVALAASLLKLSLKILKLKFTNQEMIDAVWQIGAELKTDVSKPVAAVALTQSSIVYHEGEKGIVVIPIKDVPVKVIQVDRVVDQKALLEHVKHQYKKHRQEVEALFAQLANLVDEGVIALQNKNWVELGNLFNYHQKLLNDLGVSTEPGHRQCIEAMLGGAYGAKESMDGAVLSLTTPGTILRN